MSDSIDLIPRDLREEDAEEEEQADMDVLQPIDETMERMKQQLAELRSYVYILAVSVAALAGGVIAITRR